MKVKLIRNERFAFRLSRYSPFSFVEVPICLPIMETFTASIPLLSLSVTIPFNV